MSRVGKLPIDVSPDVKVNISGNHVVIAGPKGELSRNCAPEVIVEFSEGKLTVKPRSNAQRSVAMWGLTRSLLKNMVKGVKEGYSKTLEINGVGFRAMVEGQILTLFLGYSHDIMYVIPKGIQIKTPKPTVIEISGHDNQLVGEVAAKIRSLRKPEPYKGKGIKYDNETIRRKEGKKK
jgi:large subunit ribosomal protein L6